MNRKKNENETGTHSRERNINTELRDPRIPSPPPPRGAGKKRKQSVAGKIAPPPPPHKKSKNEAFEIALDNALNNPTATEGVAKKYQSKAGGLNDKGRAHYKKKGHNLKKPVSKGQAKKSKKSAGRRKSFCSRMGGQKKMHNIDCRADPDKAICKSLKRWDCNEAFEMALDNVLSLLEGGHEYRNLTSNTFEKKLEKANRLAGSNSGRLSYDQLNKNRKDLIKQAETKRPLKRSEYINRYGYDAWLSYCFEHNIPENSKYTLPSTETQFPVDQIDHAKQ